MNKQEPPSTSDIAHSNFLVGQNARGQWVARNRCGSKGGLFVSREQALKFAMSECEHYPQEVSLVSGDLEIDMRIKRALVAINVPPQILSIRKRAA